MGTPRKRKSHSKTRMGRAHHALNRHHLYSCPRCGETRMPHRICATCGTYATRGKEKMAIDVEAAISDWAHSVDA